MSKRPWYKRYGGDFVLGTMSLSLEEKGAYSLCLDLIYDRGAPIPDDARWLAGVCGVSLRKWASLRARLVETGKIVVSDGLIGNPRAAREMAEAAETAAEHAENGSKGGRKRAENAAKTDLNSPENGVDASENNNIAEAGLKPIQKPEIDTDKPPVVPQGDEGPSKAIRLRQADVEAVWSITPQSARTRTSRADVQASLQAAARRGRPPALILAGLKAYYASPAATKDNGQFAKGAHRMIEKDRYLDFLDDGPPPAAPAPVDPWPGRLREFVRNGHWNAVDWGPRPGKPDCRAPPELITEHCPTIAKDRAA